MPLIIWNCVLSYKQKNYFSDLVGCFEFSGPLRQYLSLYQAVSQREGERGEGIEESKNVQTTPPPHTHTYCKRSRPLPYYYPNCRTPRHWKFTQDHHRTTQTPPISVKISLFCREITFITEFPGSDILLPIFLTGKQMGFLRGKFDTCYC